MLKIFDGDLYRGGYVDLIPTMPARGLVVRASAW